MPSETTARRFDQAARPCHRRNHCAGQATGSSVCGHDNPRRDISHQRGARYPAIRRQPTEGPDETPSWKARHTAARPLPKAPPPFQQTKAGKHAKGRTGKTTSIPAHARGPLKCKGRLRNPPDMALLKRSFPNYFLWAGRAGGYLPIGPARKPGLAPNRRGLFPHTTMPALFMASIYPLRRLCRQPQRPPACPMRRPGGAVRPGRWNPRQPASCAQRLAFVLQKLCGFFFGTAPDFPDHGIIDSVFIIGQKTISNTSICSVPFMGSPPIPNTGRLAKAHIGGLL